LSSRFERLLGDNFLQVLRLAPDLLDLIGRRGPRRVVLRYCDQVGILSPDTPNAAR
jgi:hypothetical protein